MPLPKDLILLRHGQSEANIAQRGSLNEYDLPNYLLRHDSFHRLSPKGVEQAEEAGRWLRNNGFGDFERYYVSPHIRARETASHLHLNGNWNIDDLWRERDWGEYGTVPSREAQRVRYPDSSTIRDQNFWYWKPVGGESLATGVRFRVRHILDNLRRLRNAENVIGVCHGELMSVFQFTLERLTVDAWLEKMSDPTQEISNCSILHYSRVNPDNNRVAPDYRWVRQINLESSKIPSPNNGEWRDIIPKMFSDEELTATVEKYPHIFR